MVKSRRFDYINYALSGNDDPLYTHMTDISMGIYCNLIKKCVITPIISKTRNHGFDGTGLYCGQIENAKGKHSMDMDYAFQSIDESETIMKIKGDWMHFCMSLLKGAVRSGICIVHTS